KFGLGLYFYDKPTGAGDISAARMNPRPKTLADLVTPKQLWMIRTMGREAGIDAEAECQKLLNCPLEEISKRAASTLIDHLKKQAESGQAASGPASDDGATKQKGPAAALRNLNRKLGFNDDQLLKWLRKQFGFNDEVTLD